MNKLNFHLPDSLLQRLKAYKVNTGVPLSEIIRRALDQYLPPPKDNK